MDSNNRGIPWAGYALLAGLSLGWGLAWPFMKIALNEISPWTFRVITLLGGGGAMLLLARASGLSLAISQKEMGPLLLTALLNITGWHLGSAFGLSLMQAGRAVIIGFTMPLWATLLCKYLLKEQIGPQKWLGLAVGCAGLAMLLWPDLEKVTQSTRGALLMLAAAVCWGAGSVLIKYFTWRMPTSVLTGWQLILGCMPVMAGAFVNDVLAIPGGISGQVWLCVAIVVLVPILFCHWAWTTMVRMLPAHVAVNSTLLIPLIGVVSSALILGESIAPSDWAALVCVLVAIFLILRPKAA